MHISKIDINQNNPELSNKEKVLNSTDNKIVYAAKAVFWSLAMFFNPIVDFFTQGLSDFLGLETLRHGTSFQNYINIRITGGKPNHSHKSGGATSGFQAIQAYDNGDYLFVSKDSESHAPDIGRALSHFHNRVIISRFYCGLSASNTFKGKGWLFLIPRIVIVVLSVLLVPTVKFRFKPEDINNNRFENDPDSASQTNPEKGLAYRTKQAIGTEHIGFMGIINQGLQGNVWARMKAHPVKATWGLVKLINPIGILLLLGVGIAALVKK